MTIKQLRARLNRLALPRADAGGPDPTLAAQWDNSAGARLYELRCKTKALTDEEGMECTHLQACQDAWRRLHFPREIEREGVERKVYGWTRADTERLGELVLKGWRDTKTLTRKERNELERLEAKRPQREPDKSILAFQRALVEAESSRKDRPVSRTIAISPSRGCRSPSAGAKRR